MRRACLVASLVGAMVVSAGAADYAWTWDAHSNRWHATRLVATDPIQYVSNFGTVGAPPYFPQAADNVTVGASHPTYGDPTIDDGNVTIGGLTVTRLLQVTSGRTLNVSAGLTNIGTFRVYSAANLDGNAVNTGLIDVHRGGVLTTYSLSLVNDGTIQLNTNTGMGNGTMRVASAGLVLSGTGELWCGADLYGASFTNGPGHTIRYGAGAIRAAMTNEGVVNADRAGATLTISEDGKVNRGVMKATNAAYLDLRTVIVQEANGVILSDGGTVNLRGATIQGGRLDTEGASEIQTYSNTVNTIADLTNDGLLRVVNNTSTLVLAGSGIVNQGQIVLTENTGMGAGEMRIDSNILLSGAGELWCRARLYASAGNTLTNAAGHTIRYGDAASGEGRIEVALVNDGVVRSDYSGRTISIRGAAKTNHNLMEATGGGSFDIYCAVNQDANGIIAASGGTVNLHGATIQGGRLHSEGGGEFQTYSNTVNTIADLTSDALLRVVNNTSTLVLTGSGIVNQGTIVLTDNTGMGAGEMRIDSNVLLSGTGEVWCRARLYSGTDSTLTNAAGHTIRYGDAASGEGRIEVALVNDGVVRSDYSGRTISVRGAAKTNHNLMEATSGGSFDIYCAVNQDANGIIAAIGGTVNLRGAMIQGGRLHAEGGGEFQTYSNTVNTIADLTSDALLRVVNNTSTLVLTGSGIVNQGTIVLTDNTGMGAGEMRIDSNVLLSGTGEVWCRARLYSGTDSTLTNAAGHTIRYGDSASGEGRIEAALVNDGVVRSDYSGKTISIRGAAKTNNNLMEATGGGYLDISCTVNQGANGTIAANGGNVRLFGGAIVGGSLRSTGSSIIESVSGTSTTIADLTNDGVIRMWNNSSYLLVRGTVVNNGTIELVPNTGMGSGRMRLESDANFEGVGEVIVNADIYTTGGFHLNNRAGHTIKGRGTVSVLVNNEGAVESDQSGRTLSLSGGAVQFSGGTLTGGTWIARANATLSVSGGTSITTSQATVVLDGVGSVFSYINSLADNQGTFEILSGRNFSTAGSLANSGVVRVGAGSRLTVNGNYSSGLAARTCIDGNLTVTGTATILGTLCGAGAMGAVSLGAGATLAPGDSPGTLTTGDLSLGDGVLYEWEIDATGHDLTRVLGDLTFGPETHLRVLLYGDVLPANGDYALFEASGTIGPLGLWDIELPNGWSCGGVGQVGGQVVLESLTTPEPATLLLLAVGGPALLRRRRKA